MAFLSSLLERRGVLASGELAMLLNLYADVIAESEPGEAAVLAYWAAVAGNAIPH